MAKIHFHLSEAAVGALTWGEYEAFELAQEGQPKLHMLRPVLARFMVDEKGASVPHEQAMRVLKALPMDDIAGVVKTFMDSLSEKAVPKASGDLSSPGSSQADGSPGG